MEKIYTKLFKNILRYLARQALQDGCLRKNGATPPLQSVFLWVYFGQEIVDLCPSFGRGLIWVWAQYVMRNIPRPDTAHLGEVGKLNFSLLYITLFVLFDFLEVNITKQSYDGNEN